MSRSYTKLPHWQQPSQHKDSYYQFRYFRSVDKKQNFARDVLNTRAKGKFKGCCAAPSNSGPKGFEIYSGDPHTIAGKLWAKRAAHKIMRRRYKKDIIRQLDEHYYYIAQDLIDESYYIEDADIHYTFDEFDDEIYEVYKNTDFSLLRDLAEDKYYEDEYKGVTLCDYYY